MREAHAKAVAAPPAIDELMAAPATRAIVDPPAAEEGDTFDTAEPADRHLAPVARAETPLDGVRAELIRRASTPATWIPSSTASPSRSSRSSARATRCATP